MPGVASGYRVVLDESSLALHEMERRDIDTVFQLLADLLTPLSRGSRVALMNHVYDTECWESVRFAEVCGSPIPEVDRDTRVRLASVLDKCVHLEPEEEDLPRIVEGGGFKAECSFGMAHAIRCVKDGSATGALALPSISDSWPEGWTKLRVDDQEVELHRMSSIPSLHEFLRGICVRDPITESDFFAAAAEAFPLLMFAEGLDFRRFRGSYVDVLPWVVSLLGTVNDHFAESLDRNRGDRNGVMSDFSAVGLTISPESPQTRRNRAAWNERFVSYRGVKYLCEWHGKRTPIVDRVHFSLPIEAYGDKILVGLFVDHLPT